MMKVTYQSFRGDKSLTETVWDAKMEQVSLTQQLQRVSSFRLLFTEKEWAAAQIPSNKPAMWVWQIKVTICIQVDRLFKSSIWVLNPTLGNYFIVQH